MGFFGIKTASDMFNKLDSEYGRFKSDPSDPNLSNFFVTAYHLKDYLEKTKAVPENALKAFITDQDIKDSRDLCDIAKHHTLTHRKDRMTWTLTGEIGGTSIGELEIGAGDKRMLYSVTRSVDVDWLADRVILKWRDFLNQHGLLPAPS